MQENKEKLYGVQDSRLEEIHKTNKLGYSMLKHMLEEHTAEDPLGIVALLPEYATENYTVLLDNIFFKVNSLYELYKMFVFSYLNVYIYIYNTSYNTSYNTRGIYNNNTYRGIYNKKNNINNINNNLHDMHNMQINNMHSNQMYNKQMHSNQLHRTILNQKINYTLEEINKIKNKIKNKMHTADMQIIYTCNQVINMLSNASKSILQEYILKPDDFIYAVCKLLQRMYTTTACRKKYIQEKNAVVTAYITGIAIVDTVTANTARRRKG